ncbi:hypothetical protein Q1695_003623 [Nippostrongylus brasiliensis]|nr:hypothetical protein Q1695_003623 [Nippostrongylus brasiliensis]
MSRLVVVLWVIFIGCLAKRNATDVPLFCEEYVDCMERANRKSAECLEENTTTIARGAKKRCEGAVELHSELQALYDARNVEVESCVRDKINDTAVLSTRKIEKCKTALKKSKRSTATSDALERRQKRKDRNNRKEKPKSCTREAKKIRLQCSKIAKCCTVVKDCQERAVQRKEITFKKKQLKKLYDVCNDAEAKKRRAARRTVKDDSDSDKEKSVGKLDKTLPKYQKKRSKLNEKLEESLERKRTAPIQTKVLREVG